MSSMLRQKQKHPPSSPSSLSFTSAERRLGKDDFQFSSSSPAASSSPSFCSRHCRAFCSLLVVLVAAAVSSSLVYYFINDADIIDEHFDLAALSEPSAPFPSSSSSSSLSTSSSSSSPSSPFLFSSPSLSRVSIRVRCPMTKKATNTKSTAMKRIKEEAERKIKKFVEHYAICPAVREIGIISSDSEDSSYCGVPEKDFAFTKTHAPVRVVQEGSSSSPWASSEGMLLLDADVFITCDDVEYTHSVWRSASTSMVGVFPRIHTKTTTGASSAVYAYYDWPFVWWNSKYSLVHSAGAEIHRDIWQRYITNTAVKDVLQSQPVCHDVLPSFWVSRELHAPPVWVDVDVRVESEVESSVLSAHQSKEAFHPVYSFMSWLSNGVDKREVYSKCLNMLAKKSSNQSNSNPVLYSTHKASQGKEVLCW